MDVTAGASGFSPPKTLAFMQQQLASLTRHSLQLPLVTVTGSAEPWVTIDGRRLLNLASNCSLSLSTHPLVRQAAKAAIDDHAAGTCTSRLLGGNPPIAEELERRFAAFKGTEAALLFSSGYMANIGVIPALVGPRDQILGDTLNHASTHDGIRLSGATYHPFRHNDMAHLQDLLAHAPPKERKLVITESIFSMDGDQAPLGDVADLCRRYQAMLLVDEAHATGCIGPGGRGLVAQLGLEQEVTLAVNTLGKALGSHGAIVTASQLVIDYLRHFVRTFIFTTGLPPASLAAALAALAFLEDHPQVVDRLQRNATFLRDGLRALGFDTLASETHIIPLRISDANTTLQVAYALTNAGVFAGPIRFPAVYRGTARIRASVVVGHSQEDLGFALSAFARVGRCFGLIA